MPTEGSTSVHSCGVTCLCGCGGKVSPAEGTEPSRSHSPLFPPHSGCSPHSAALCSPGGTALGWASGDSQMKPRHLVAARIERDNSSGAVGLGPGNPRVWASVRSCPDVGGGLAGEGREKQTPGLEISAVLGRERRPGRPLQIFHTHPVTSGKAPSCTSVLLIKLVLYDTLPLRP